MDRPVVFITGANTGLGLETVKALFQSPKSYTILLGARNKEKADAAVQQLRAEFPQSATVVAPVHVDLENDLSIERAFDFVVDRYGRVDVLINNAGRNPDPDKLNLSMSVDSSLRDDSLTSE
jgi:NAD(P)-dependent dehydrogenase (short-subunit alcohol dehydrogenase family)